LSQAAADVAHDAGLAVVFPRGAEASADHDIHGVGTVAFTKEDFTGGQPFPADGGEKFSPIPGSKPPSSSWRTSRRRAAWR
jgi:hypothetical protein